MRLQPFTVTGKDFKLKDFKTYIESDDDKQTVKEKLTIKVQEIAELQSTLYAQDKYGVLLIIQAMDTAGKDGIIKHVMTGLNPQSTVVHPFKQPSQEELDHTWLWKGQYLSPTRGGISIFNRSYYEEVLVVKVHKLLKAQKIPEKFLKNVWKERYEDIRNFEKHLYRNGIEVIKIFL